MCNSIITAYAVYLQHEDEISLQQSWKPCYWDQNYIALIPVSKGKYLVCSSLPSNTFKFCPYGKRKKLVFALKPIVFLFDPRHFYEEHSRGIKYQIDATVNVIPM